MSSQLSYALRFGQYLNLMLLFGLPLFSWYFPAARVEGSKFRLLRYMSSGLLVCALLGLALIGVEAVHRLADIMGVVIFELVPDDMAWYLFDTQAGRAGLTRAFLLGLLLAVLGWHLRNCERPLPFRAVTLLAAGALASLAWNGHAAGGEGVGGTIRLAVGIAHLLAAGGWIGAIAGLLMLLVHQANKGTGADASVWRILHDFSGPGTALVGILMVSGTFYYGDMMAWSFGAVFDSRHGTLLMLKLSLFIAMLALAGLHRWWLVPQLAFNMHGQATARQVRRLRLSVALEATFAILILGVVAVLGTLSPRG